MSMWSLDKRPRVFEEIFGQAMVKELQTIATMDRPPAAILLSGATGVGKTSAAYVLARSLTCLQPRPDGNPCNECDNCRDSLEERWSRDLIILDSSKLAKDDLMELEELVGYLPLHSPRKVVVIEEVQELTTRSRNTFLKLLEARHDHVVLIFTTMDVQKLGTAITSRCRHFRFRQPGPTRVAEFLMEVVESADPRVFADVPEDFYGQPLFALAEAAEGSYRQALQFLERCVNGRLFSIDDIRQEFESAGSQQVFQDLLDLLALKPEAVARIQEYAANFFFRSIYTLVACMRWQAEGRPDTNEYEAGWYRQFSQHDQALRAVLRLYRDVGSRPWSDDGFLLELYCLLDEQRHPRVGTPVGSGIGTPNGVTTTRAVGSPYPKGPTTVPVRQIRS